MTDQHPLNDKMCWEIAGTWRESSYCDGCRAASDWQLEQDAKYWTIVLNKAKFIPPQTVDYIIEQFKQAKRPQEDN